MCVSHGVRAQDVQIKVKHLHDGKAADENDAAEARPPCATLTAISANGEVPRAENQDTHLAGAGHVDVLCNVFLPELERALHVLRLEEAAATRQVGR